MADLKISQLTGATTPLAGTEVLPIVQSSTTKKVAVSDLTAGRAISATQLTLTTGNVIVASGQGIDFSASSHAAGMTSELLNDYEEGTWTPVIQFGGASTGITYSRQSGTYTKVGNVVTVVFDMRLTSKGTATGGLTIEGLPFASAGGVSAGFAISQLYLYSGFVGLTKMGTAYTNGSTVLNEPIDSLSVAITDTNFTNSAILFASFTYRAA